MAAATDDSGPSSTSTVHHVLEIATSPGAVFRALTMVAGLSGWWTTGVSGDAESVGGTIRFAFGGSFNPVMRVTTLRPPTHVEWHGCGGHDAWGSPTTIRFMLRADGSGTVTDFRHSLGSAVGHTTIASANFNWAYYLNSLRTLCETGTGQPFQPGDPAARVGADSIGPAVPAAGGVKNE